MSEMTDTEEEMVVRLTERETEDAETLLCLEKQHKFCLHNRNIGMKGSFTQMFFLTNDVTQFQLLSVTFIEQTLYLIDKIIWGKMGGVY